MSNHAFECRNGGHVILDVSDEPVPHVSEETRIYCPECEQDVDGIYIGQATEFETRHIGDTVEMSEIEIYEDGGGVYCIHCDGPCEEV